ncbi:MAG TPA: hypothetical protein VH373_11840 [Jatrophihabitantaceae bacterium]|jgi:hypothetical protein
MRITATAVTTLALGLSYLAYLAPAGPAGAMPEPPPETYANQAPPPGTVVVNHTSTPVWPYIVAAVVAAALTLAVVWAITRLRHGHAHAGAPASVV